MDRSNLWGFPRAENKVRRIEAGRYLYYDGVVLWYIKHDDWSGKWYTYAYEKYRLGCVASFKKSKKRAVVQELRCLYRLKQELRPEEVER